MIMVKGQEHQMNTFAFDLYRSWSKSCSSASDIFIYFLTIFRWETVKDPPLVKREEVVGRCISHNLKFLDIS